MACCGGGSAGIDAVQELAASLPVTVRTPAEIPAVQITTGHTTKLLGCIVSELDPNSIHRPLHVRGPSPRIPLPSSSHVTHQLTQCYLIPPARAACAAPR